ncbi:MAG: WG repeat-containing protein [Bacteroidia bacterium]|jgi:hypothetical protein|nr:WG repeat-containing protein [Bacteroidia bacterium]
MNAARITAILLCLLLYGSSRAQRPANPNARVNSWAARNSVWFISDNETPRPNRYPVRVQGQWGYCDAAGKAVVTPGYDAAFPFIMGIGVVQKNGLLFAIDSNGRQLIRQGYDMIRPISASLLAIYLNNTPHTPGGWGIADTSGNILLTPGHDEVAALPGGMLAYRSDTLWGYATPAGKILVDALYDTAYFVRGGLLVLRTGNKLGVITTTGIRIAPDSCNDLSLILQNQALGFRCGRHWGVARLTDGQRIIPCRYDTVHATGQYFITAKKGDTLSLFTSYSGRRVAHGEYKRFFDCGPGYARKVADKDKCGLVDTNGTEILPEIYSGLEYALELRWRVSTKDKWGLVDENGKFVLPMEFQWISTVFRGVVVGTKQTLKGLYSRNGETLVAAAEQELLFRGNTIKALRKDGNATFITLDESGKIIERIEYNNMRTIKIGGDSRMPQRALGENWGSRPFFPMSLGATLITNFQWYYNNKLWGLYDSFTGDTLIEAQFEYLISGRNWGGRNGVYTIAGNPRSQRSVEINGKVSMSQVVCGLVCDTTGKFVLPCTYSWINQDDANRNRFNGWVRCIRSDGQYGLVRIDGSEQFIPVSLVENPAIGGYAKICRGGVLTTEAEKSDYSLGSINQYGGSVGIDLLKTFPAPNNETDPITRQTLYLKGGTWGYINRKGEIVIEPKYEQVGAIRAGRCLFRENKKWGLTDSTGAVLIAPQYSGLRFTTSNDTLLISIKNDPRYGFTDTLGQELSLPASRKALVMGEQRLALSIKGKWALYDYSGKAITGEDFQAIEPFSEGLAAVQRAGKWGFIDTSGSEVVAAQYISVGPFCSGRARVKIKNKWGYIDRSGALVIDAVYDNVKDFSFGTAPVRVKTGWQLIDAQGQAVTKPAFSSIEPVKGSSCLVVRVAQNVALADSKGKPLTAYKYERIGEATQGRMVARQGIKWAILDTLGREIYPPELDRATSYHEGWMAVRWRDGWGYINLKGKKMPGPLYRTAAQFSEGLAAVSFYSGKVAYIDTAGNVVFYLSGNSVCSPFSNGLAFIHNGRLDKGYYITTQGARLKGITVNEGRGFYHGAAQVKQGYTWGLLSFAGRMLTPFHYSELQPWNDGIALWRRSVVYGICTASGREHLPTQFDYIAYVPGETSVLMVTQGNALGYLRNDGTWLWPMQQ